MRGGGTRGSEPPPPAGSQAEGQTRAGGGASWTPWARSPLFFFFFESRKLVALSDTAFVGREEWINRTFFQDIGGRRIKLL